MATLTLLCTLLLITGGTTFACPVADNGSNEINKMRGCHVTFKNKLNMTLAVVAVSDQTDTSGPPTFVQPGQAAFFSRAFRGEFSKPDLRLRVYTTKQGSQGVVMDEMRQVYACYNPAVGAVQFGVHADPFEHKGTMFNNVYEKFGERHAKDINVFSQRTRVHRDNDSDDHKIFQVEIHQISPVPTGDYPLVPVPVPVPI